MTGNEVFAAAAAYLAQTRPDSEEWKPFVPHWLNLLLQESLPYENAWRTIRRSGWMSLWFTTRRWYERLCPMAWRVIFGVMMTMTTARMIFGRATLRRWRTVCRLRHRP